jgi:hypothetical protein
MRCLGVGVGVALAWALALLALPAWSVVKYDEGRRVINGVQLLQDAQDESLYWYLPQYPRVARKEDGETLEFLCVKYVGKGGDASGGIFHALVEFTLTPEDEATLAKALAKEIGGARLAGPVPLMQAVEDGEKGVGSFRVVSATLSDSAEGGFTRSLVASGRAPLTPGSKASLAASLSQQGATLLFDTFQAPTSDVSVAITAYYEAQVRAYNAMVHAKMDVVYEHFSRVMALQQHYTKRQLRDITDEMRKDGAITIEVADRSQGLGIDASSMEAIVDLVTSKLTDLMFDAEMGWAKAPEREQAVEGGQLAGRQERGGFAKFFAGTGDQEYVTDNQYVLKKRKDINRNEFTLNLSRSTTIRVPFDTAGNIGGFYSEYGEDPRYFRIVNMDDKSFQKREVYFRVDGDYIDSFQDTVNFVSVNFRKVYEDDSREAETSSLIFTHDDIKNGITMKSVTYPRLGDSDAGWLDYEYQVRWSVRDRPTVPIPKNEEEWLKTADPAISLTPPFHKRIVEIDADRELFAEAGIRTAVVEFATPIVGKPKLVRRATLKAGDAEPSTTVSIYHDRGSQVGWRVKWYSTKGSASTQAQELDSDYLYLVPPAPDGSADASTQP